MFTEGQSFSFDAAVSETMIDEFAELTGDANPLHMDRDFAIQRGFKDRVVHGALLGGLVSRLIGMHLPGRDCLLHSMNLKYPAPTYANDLVRITGMIERVSVLVKAMTIQVVVLNLNSQAVVAKGKVTVVLTSEV
jgi:3-hydroxybutyryl-CoA dehydratase